jgi:hypothetical protein
MNLTLLHGGADPSYAKAMPIRVHLLDWIAWLLRVSLCYEGDPIGYRVIPNMRWSWCALIPFLLAHIKCIASSHLWGGFLERSNTVPTVTVNCRRQSLHWTVPGRCFLP